MEPFSEFSFSRFCTLEHRECLSCSGLNLPPTPQFPMWFKPCFISNWLLVLHQPEDPGAWSHLVQCFAARNSDKVWGTTDWKTAGRAEDSSRKAKTSDAEEKQRIWLSDSSGEDGAAPAGSSGKKTEPHTCGIYSAFLCKNTIWGQIQASSRPWGSLASSFLNCLILCVFSVHASTRDISLCKIVLAYFEF